MNGMPFDEQLVDIVGPNDQSKPGGEAQLDISWIMAMGRGAPTKFLSFCGPGPAKGPCGAYVLDWAMWVGNQTAPPLVTSISYGDTEGGYAKKFAGFSYIDRMELELTKMAARGLTVVAGSGDAGATNVSEEGNDISQTDPDCSKPRPFFPSDSKYVVSLSSSLLSTHTTPFCNIPPPTLAGAGTNVLCERVGEASVSMTYGGTYWTTGGGMSGHIAAPDYQRAAIASYKAQVAKLGYALPKSGTYNPQGRMYADLTTLGFNLNIVLNGKVGPIGGTSASGPLMGGLFTIINDRLLALGRPPLGAPHHWLYGKLASTNGAYNDLTYGRNDDGDWQPRHSPYKTLCPGAGFPLTPGPDAVSGFGSPNMDVWFNNLP
eukprot:TRINITY_DN3961_c0_g1_i2.p1 TRINITY_DN3961_c0_g1~~TRINITY_DN3961_c0_g1_i2.p1  ORF type:complete len:375 (-),score=231.42 TRINITY_DN3961_c0_g1_i2:47-1171(-)